MAVARPILTVRSPALPLAVTMATLPDNPEMPGPGDVDTCVVFQVGRRWSSQVRSLNVISDRTPEDDAITRVTDA